jgi:hypothetical protein
MRRPPPSWRSSLVGPSSFDRSHRRGRPLAFAERIDETKMNELGVGCNGTNGTTPQHGRISRITSRAGGATATWSGRSLPSGRPEAGPVGRPDDKLRVSESVRRLYGGLQSFLSMRRIEARRKKASALRSRFSQSLASLRHRLSQAMVRSTIQRRGILIESHNSHIFGSLVDCEMSAFRGRRK